MHFYLDHQSLFYSSGQDPQTLPDLPLQDTKFMVLYSNMKLPIIDFMRVLTTLKLEIQKIIIHRNFFQVYMYYFSFVNNNDHPLVIYR